MSIEAGRGLPPRQRRGQHWSAEGRDYLRSLCAGPDEVRADSIVVAGSDLAAYVFVARLARSDAFAGRVAMLSPPRRVTRRLAASVTLHPQALAGIGAAIGTRAAALLDGTPDTAHPASRHAALDPLHAIRHDALLMSLHAATGKLGVMHAVGCPPGPRRLLELARGRYPLLVNATGNPLLFRPAAPPPRRHLVGVQCAFRPVQAGAAAPDRASRSWRRVRWPGCGGGFLPFADPLSSEASWCGYGWRLGQGGLPDAWPGPASMAADLLAAARMQGLAPVDPDETMGWLVHPLPPARPALRYLADAGRATGWFELRRAWEAAPPSCLLDGRAAVAVGRAAAEAVLRGEAPQRAAILAVRRLRRQVLAGRLRGPVGAQPLRPRALSRMSPWQATGAGTGS